MVDVPIRIENGDLLLVDGTAYQVQVKPRGEDDEWQLAIPGSMMDVTKTRSDLEQLFAEAETFVVAR